MNNLNNLKTMSNEDIKRYEDTSKNIQKNIQEDYLKGKNLKVVLENNSIKLFKEGVEIKIDEKVCGLIEIYCNTVKHLLDIQFKPIEDNTDSEDNIEDVSKDILKDDFKDNLESN